MLCMLGLCAGVPLAIHGESCGVYPACCGTYRFQPGLQNQLSVSAGFLHHLHEIIHLEFIWASQTSAEVVELSTVTGLLQRIQKPGICGLWDRKTNFQSKYG